MNRKGTYSIWGDASKEDICTTRFLKLLLKYNYVWRREDEETFKLNLSKEQKADFLQEFNDFDEYIGELQASVTIINVRHLYDEEFDRLLNHSEGAGDPKFPWFSLADQLFRRKSLFSTVEIPVSAPLTNFPRPPENERLHISPKKKFTKQGSDSLEALRTEDAAQSPNSSQSQWRYTTETHIFQSSLLSTLFFCLCPPIPRTAQTANFKYTISDASKSQSGIGSMPENLGGYDLLDANASPPLADCGSTEAASDSISHNYESFNSLTAERLPSPTVQNLTPLDSYTSIFYIESASTSPATRPSTSPESRKSIPSHAIILVSPANSSAFPRPKSATCQDTRNTVSFSPVARVSTPFAALSSTNRISTSPGIFYALPVSRFPTSPTARCYVSHTDVFYDSPTPGLYTSPAVELSDSPSTKKSILFSTKKTSSPTSPLPPKKRFSKCISLPDM